MYPRLVWSIFLFIYFFLNIRPCFVPKGEKRQAQKNTCHQIRKEILQFFFFKFPAFVPKMLRAKRPAQKYIRVIISIMGNDPIEIVCGQYISPRPSSLFTGWFSHMRTMSLFSLSLSSIFSANRIYEIEKLAVCTFKNTHAKKRSRTW